MLMLHVDDGVIVIVVALSRASQHRQFAAGLPGSVRRRHHVGGHRQPKRPARQRAIDAERGAAGEAAPRHECARHCRVNPVTREQRAAEVLRLERSIASARGLPDPAPRIRDVTLLLVEHTGQPAVRLGRPRPLGVRVFLIARLSGRCCGNGLSGARQCADDSDEDRAERGLARAHDRRLFPREREAGARFLVVARDCLFVERRDGRVFGRG